MAPYIEEVRPKEVETLPMHHITQGFIDTLRQMGHVVVASSNPSTLSYLAKGCDGIVVVANGGWLYKEIESLKPTIPVLYFYIGGNSDKPVSPFIKSFSAFSEDDFLWPFQFLRDFNSAF